MALETRPEVAEAVAKLETYVRGGLSLDELIAWAEHVEGKTSEDSWLQRVQSDLANPLLCREQAMALVREHLRSRAAAEQRKS